MAIHTVGPISYHVNNSLLKHWQKNSLNYMNNKNQDRVYIVDGMERSGKSTFAFQQAGVLDKKMFSSVDEFLKRVCFTPEEFFHAIRHTKNGVIVFDEAFRGFSSRAALSKINKKLNAALMEMGQNNNIVFLVLPRIFLLDIYPAMLRSNALFNIFIDKKSGKRVWRGFNYQDKNRIYQIGTKKGWRYPIKTKFKGNFYAKFPGGDEFQKAYEKKKNKALREMDTEVKREEEIHRYELQRNLLLEALYNEQFKSFRKLSAWLKAHNFEMSHQMIAKIVRKSVENPEKASIDARKLNNNIIPD